MNIIKKILYMMTVFILICAVAVGVPMVLNLFLIDLFGLEKDFATMLSVILSLILYFYYCSPSFRKSMSKSEKEEKDKVLIKY